MAVKHTISLSSFPLRLIIVCPPCYNRHSIDIDNALFAALSIRIAIDRRPSASCWYRSCWNVIVQGSTLSTSNSVYIFKLHFRFRSLEFVVHNNRFRRQLIVEEFLKFVYFCIRQLANVSKTVQKSSFAVIEILLLLYIYKILRFCLS